MPSEARLDMTTSRRKSAVIEVFGWYGAAAIIGAYALNSFELLGSDSAWYQVVNLTGSLGILTVSWVKRVMQPVALNVVWSSIAVVALVRMAL